MDFDAQTPLALLLEQEWPALADLWAVSRYLSQGLYEKDFVPSPSWATAVKLSEDGLAAQAVIKKAHKGSTPEGIAFYLLREFYMTGLLIDPDGTDIDACKSLLQEMSATESVKWPQFFGKELYEEFNLTHPPGLEDYVAPSDIDSILLGLPAGIFQVGTLLFGPLGFLESEERRASPPTLRLPLRHCTDTGCRALHHVQVRQYPCKAINDCVDYHRALIDEYNTPSSWEIRFERFASGSDTAFGNPFADMVGVITECIVPNEIDSLSCLF